jgi:hypothetical protein
MMIHNLLEDNGNLYSWGDNVTLPAIQLTVRYVKSVASNQSFIVVLDGLYCWFVLTTVYKIEVYSMHEILFLHTISSPKILKNLFVK